MSDYIIDGGVHILNGLEVGQRSARHLRGEDAKENLNHENTFMAKKRAAASPCGSTFVNKHVEYLSRFHFPRDGDKLIDAKVLCCILVTW